MAKTFAGELVDFEGNWIGMLHRVNVSAKRVGFQVRVPAAYQGNIGRLAFGGAVFDGGDFRLIERIRLNASQTVNRYAFRFAA